MTGSDTVSKSVLRSHACLCLIFAHLIMALRVVSATLILSKKSRVLEAKSRLKSAKDRARFYSNSTKNRLNLTTNRLNGGSSFHT